MNSIGWNIPQRITLGVKAATCQAIMEEWLYRKAPTVMTVRRAKTAGLVLVSMDIDPVKDVTAVYFAAWCIQRGGSDVKVDIKPLK